MLKVVLILVVILSLALLLFLAYQSQKMLRHVQKQQALENRQNGKSRQLHPKLRQDKKPQDYLRSFVAMDLLAPNSKRSGQLQTSATTHSKHFGLRAIQQ